MTFYVYEFYADSDKDEFLIEWLSDEQIDTIAKVCDYDFVKCYESFGIGCKGKLLYEKELEGMKYIIKHYQKINGVWEFTDWEGTKND